MKIFLLLPLAVFITRFYIVNTSYLDVPRIHFKGKFRADVNSRNNWACNFDIKNELYERQEWNYKGTNEWEFIETYVTSVIDENGEDVDSPLIGGQIFSSEDGPLAKVVDLDVEHQVTTLYGLKFRIVVAEETILRGDWVPAVIVREMWNQMNCSHSNWATISTSVIANVTCPTETESRSLCEAWQTEQLSVSISLSDYSGDVFTMGSVVGTIGIAKEGESLNVGGQRKLKSTKIPLEKCPNENHEYSVQEGVNVVPFLYDKNRKTLVLDISNAFSVDVDSKNVIDFGEFWLGVLKDETVTMFGDPLPYTEQSIWERGGIIECMVPEGLENIVETSPLVIAMEVDSNSSGDHIYPVAELFPTLDQLDFKVMVLLLEPKYFVRPTGSYLGRLEYGNPYYGSDEMNVTLFVTSFGKPAGGVTVKVDAGPRVLPPNGTIALENSKSTDSDGLATFTFKANRTIPFPRSYLGENNPCEDGPSLRATGKPFHFFSAKEHPDFYQLPIDGQVYHFCYFAVAGNETPRCTEDVISGIQFSELITFLAFSTINYERPYTWVDHVAPIFKQVHHVHHVMRSVLDMSSYKEVTRPHNMKLLKMVLNKDINDAGYMPVTRDLSPNNRRMILEWLERPCFSILDCITLIDKCKSPPSKSRIMPEEAYERCGDRKIQRKSDPQKFFKQIYANAETPTFAARASDPPRPLFGYGSKEEMEEANSFSWASCDLHCLKHQLQLAIQLEFSTIPLYLTSLYTIMEHCNVEAYHLTRNIIVQEMLHFAQAANILIAIGGKVRIDSKEVVPHYPTTGLPGGVLPNLTLTLEKFTLKHVHDNFMALEVPAYTTIPKPHDHCNTIGQFYNEIQECMEHLGDEIFEDANEAMQVEWPWETPTNVGTLYKVTDLESAMRAIEQIVEQGEGASDDSPVDESTKQHAHFFRFEEIFCENKLEVDEDGCYSYTGRPIPYNRNGVWNMKESLAISDIEKGTECHTQARAFHSVYRTFLRVLQETFDGHPEKVDETIKLMQVLKVHATRTVWTPLKSATQEEEEIMCGPIWDYDWDE